MTLNCDVIRDLLPLYADDICSRESRKIVEEHIKSCEKCQKELKSLQNDEITGKLNEEKEGVVRREKKRARRAAFTVGLVFAAIFSLPVLICLIVNLATGQGLSWFFIVLTALLLAASLIVVPLMVPRRRLLWTLGASTVSLLLLLLTCAVYSSGDWFFVVSLSVLFGISVIFAPIVANREPLKEKLGKNRFLAVLGADTLLYAAMMLSIGLYTHLPGFGRIVFFLTRPVLVLLYGIALICRFARGRRKR